MSQPSSPPSPVLLSLAKAYLHDPAHLHKIIIPQLTHRLRLATLWSIAPSTKVLDIGCGQGDSALALAHVVGSLPPDASDTASAGAAPSDGPPGTSPGHVTGLDPAPGGYGSPYTLAESQAHILSSPYGARVTFHQSDAPGYLAAHPSASFDYATLCHSLWYFPSAAAVSALFEALHSSGRVGRLCFAEYSLKASTPSQKPHEMAVAVQRRFHQLRGDRGFTLSQANVRGALDPDDMVTLAQGAGWKLKKRGVVDTPGMLDGQWEVGAVVDPSWAEEVVGEGLAKEVEEELLGNVADIKAAVANLKENGESVATMDAVWVVMEP
ncbi:SAM-dependent methyltransferase [Colletotrichum graminicola]|uniref:SAM-dependent methyltransferase n=1 Tax=Colletotrichum graminicola (strain M1.001 / M2 / FGSC 10212) TaxID=645133 RepID=E3QPY0_COLGM|nr:SAM-dependent methyltransferase [Colletotrichum graminicola M1.001]EFQ32918.1 SAM-dependent methyltransferase [Colletotrichum graminicola M1.001]WDK09347.1 SAM-dependent methyltransferase [Colletotrichum graminicola]